MPTPYKANNLAIATQRAHTYSLTLKLLRTTLKVIADADDETQSFSDGSIQPASHVCRWADGLSSANAMPICDGKHIG